jgi:transposase-like protein
MARKRRIFTPEKKLQIVKEGLQKDVKIAELCRLYDIYPTDFYKWKKQAENGMKNGFKSTKKEVTLSVLEQKQSNEIKRLESVIIQLTKEHLDLKKKVYG